MFYDEDARAQFVEQHCSDIVVKALHSLIPAAFRSDLFRYIFAYLNACIYFDVKMILHMPISAVYDLSQSDQLFVKDDHPGAVYNAFFINWRPKAEVFKYVIVLCLDRIIWNEYGDCTLSVTGPTVLGLAKRRDDGAEEKLFKVSEAGDWQNSVIRDRTGTIIISCSYPGYYEENDYIGKYHYGTLWEKRRVFRFSPPVFFPYYIRGEENILKGVDHVLWINLAEAKQRREETEFILSLFSELPHTRIEAVDGRTALPLAHDGSAVDANALPAEIACCLSHLKALAAAASLTGEYFLILEDDISLRFFPFHDSRDALGQIMERAPRDWEVIVLSRAHTSELYKEFTDWQRAFDDGFHIAGTVAYLVNRSGLEKIHELFKLTDGLFSIRKPEGQRVLVEQNKRWFVADVYIYSHLKTYIYKNMIFATRNKDSYIHPDHLEWHVQAQDVTFNHISEDVILREDCIVERHMYTDRGGSTEHKRLMPDLPATASQHNPT